MTRRHESNGAKVCFANEVIDTVHLIRSVSKIVHTRDGTVYMDVCIALLILLQIPHSINKIKFKRKNNGILIEAFVGLVKGIDVGGPSRFPRSTVGILHGTLH